MTISTKNNALADLRQRLQETQDDRPGGLADLPAPFKPHLPMKDWLWRTDQARTLPGLSSPDAYLLGEHTRSLGDRVHRSPAEVLNPSDFDGDRRRYSTAQQAYVRSSLDVTMKGGIASGVIYPLALCELARSFRLRNIGGASAGAIAAALAAAAELGRARQALATTSSDASYRPEPASPSPIADRDDRDPASPRIQRDVDATQPSTFSEQDTPGQTPRERPQAPERPKSRSLYLTRPRRRGSAAGKGSRASPTSSAG